MRQGAASEVWRLRWLDVRFGGCFGKLRHLDPSEHFRQGPKRKEGTTWWGTYLLEAVTVTDLPAENSYVPRASNEIVYLCHKLSGTTSWSSMVTVNLKPHSTAEISQHDF